MDRVYIYVVDLWVSCEIFMCMDYLVRQKHELALEGTCSCIDVIDCDVELH